MTATLHSFLAGLSVGILVGLVLGYMALRLEKKQAIALAALGLASTPLFVQENQPEGEKLATPLHL